MRMKLIALALFAAFFAVSAKADPVARYDGNFTITPLVMHTEPITGKLSVMYEKDALTQVRVKLDKSIMGKTDFVSTEQWINEVAPTAIGQQVVLAFKLQGVPHKWYFVWVGTSTDGGVAYQGGIFKAKATLAEIQEALKSGSPTDPAGYKKVGDAILKR